MCVLCVLFFIVFVEGCVVFVCGGVVDPFLFNIKSY